MHRLIVAVLIALLATPSFAVDMPATEDQKTLYGLGQILARSISIFQLTPAELEYVKQGLTDTVTGKSPVVEPGSYNEKVQQMGLERSKAQGEKNAAANKVFLDKAAKEKGAVKTDSGLIYLSLKEGTGTTPIATDTVKVNYTGTLPDGKEFDSSYKRGKPAEFRLDSVIKCWVEGLQKMKVGGKARLICPPTLAYGEAGAGNLIPPNAALIFEVELLETTKIKP